MLAKGCGIWNERADAGAGARLRRIAGHVAAVEADVAGIGLQRAGDQVEERRLAGAVRADDAERRAGLDPRSISSATTTEPKALERL